jgi:hypothetical protein
LYWHFANNLLAGSNIEDEKQIRRQSDFESRETLRKRKNPYVVLEDPYVRRGLL